MTNQRWAIYPHAQQRAVTGRGYVVRECNARGEAIDAHNYEGIDPQRGPRGPLVWKREDAARKVADRMSGL